MDNSTRMEIFRARLQENRKWVFCANQCQAQRDCVPHDVVGMRDAYREFERHDYIMLPTIERTFLLDTAITLITNGKCNQFRKTPVVFQDGSKGATYHEIPRLIESLDKAFLNNRLTPEEYYQEFESIHPFSDGNGRIGAIIYNSLKGTLDAPIHPPEYKRR